MYLKWNDTMLVCLLDTLLKSVYFFSSIQLHQFLRGVSFNNSAGDTVSFNKNGEVVAGFDVINWLIFSNQSFRRVKVGRLDPMNPTDQLLTINEDIITWPSWFNQVRFKSQQCGEVLP